MYVWALNYLKLKHNQVPTCLVHFSIETIELPSTPNGDCVLLLSHVTADGTLITLIVIAVIIRHRSWNLNNIDCYYCYYMSQDMEP